MIQFLVLFCFLMTVSLLPSSEAFKARSLVSATKQLIPKAFEGVDSEQLYHADSKQLDSSIMRKFDQITIFLSQNIKKIEKLGNELVSCQIGEKEVLLQELTKKYDERKEVLTSLDHYSDEILEIYIKLQLNKIQQRDQEISNMIEDCHSFGCDFEADQYFNLREEQSMVLGPLAVYKEVLKNRQSVLGYVSDYDKHTSNL